ncbi:MAG: hypothetical protein MUF15_20055, partial [Acidobacteria bacterium]|nr:hypothetical protein [Acidobacteriota bacterium]
MRNDNSNNSVLNNQDKEKLKDSILLPYELEVVEHLRNLETYIKNQYMEQKNSFDQKSLPSGKEIKIQIEIEKKNAHATPFKRLVNLVRDYSLNLDSKIKDIEILLLLLARILHFDRKVLWTEINNFINNKSMSIEQPFYEFRWENSKHYLVIKDYVAIPKDFVAAYFGYDTGIDGLNLLMDGGFLLPPDRSTYISISGEAGIGKTSLAIKLVTAFFQNYQFKNVYCKEKKLVSNNAELLEIHYILLEQKKNNIIRLIKECQLLDLDNTNAKYILDEKKLSTNNLTENAINAIIHFEDNVLFSPMSLIEKIEEIENLNKKNENPGKEKKLPNKRNVIVIDSVNAIQEMDIRRAEWRELFQGIKAITSERNTIVIFVGEKDPQQPDSIIEYLSDVVIKLYKDYKQVAFNRVIELVKSRFQKFHHGKHTFYLTKHDSGFIRIYPSSTALSDMIPPRKRVHPPKSGIAQSEREVGIKIDGIINFFKYSHLYSAKMEPFFLKNSITMFTGDRGTHKSAFAKKFALSAFRDERWETSSGTLMEFDYREREADKPWEEIYELVRQNARPKEKAAALLLYFSENYDEDPKKDIIWETYFGKIIIPGCKTQQRSYVGYISHIVCSYEVKDLTEDVYLYQLEELIRTIESYKVDEPIPGSYTEFINRKSLSLKNRVIERTKIEGNVEFNPYLFIYQGTGILNPQEVFDYSNVKKIKVSRMVLDDAENLENVYTTLDARKYISTLAHICMAREITLGIVNTRSKERTSIVDTVCNAVSDNAFKFDKYFFKGELFTTFNIIRSATSFHNNMLYYISKRDDGLLQLKNTFALLANVEKQNPEPIGIRLFLPDFSKEFSKNIYRLLVDRDIDLVSADNSFNKPKGVAKGINFASEFKIKYGLRGLETIYKPYHKFPSIYRDWHEFIKDMIIYSLAHPNVEIFTANDPFTDVSIILDDESAKDAITILCLPGYLMDLYEKNLTTISDYIHFAGEEDNVPVLVSLNKNNGEWISFTDAPKKEGSEELKNNVEQIKLGNEFYYLKKSAIRLFSDNAKDNTKDSAEDDTKDNSKCKNMHTWIIPEILFNIVVARDENNNIIR